MCDLICFLVAAVLFFVLHYFLFLFIGLLLRLGNSLRFTKTTLSNNTQTVGTTYCVTGFFSKGRGGKKTSNVTCFIFNHVFFLENHVVEHVVNHMFSQLQKPRGFVWETRGFVSKTTWFYSRNTWFLFKTHVVLYE